MRFKLLSPSDHSRSQHCIRSTGRLLPLVILVFSLLAKPVQSGAPLPPFLADPGLAPDLVINPDQGLGQCHWLEVAILSQPTVSWGYDAGEKVSSWVVIEPQQGTFDWAPLDGQIHKASDLGKRIWLELLTTEGQTPSWARDAGVRLVGSRGGTPVPWDPVYQQLLRRAVHAMAARYDDDPTVDAINIMAGGCYGEMAICARETDTEAWEQAGYTDETFIAAVKQLIDIYLEEEYLWEDGTKTHGFLHTPVVLQLGGGLYGHTAAVIQPVVDYAMSTYGMRVWLKYNGLGGTHDMEWIFSQYSDVTRVGYEPAGTTTALEEDPRLYVQAALDQHSSFLCLQRSYFALTEPDWLQAREQAALYLGTHILAQGMQAPASITSGQELILLSRWINRGTVPLMRSQRQGSRDVPASYDIWIGFVDPTTGVVAFEQSFTPTPPTTEWYSSRSVSVESLLTLPSSLPEGSYELRVSLVNPDLSDVDPARHFNLLNTTLDDGQGRYRLGEIRVVHPTPVLQPTPTLTLIDSTPPQRTDSGLVRLLRAVWQWLLAIFQ